MTDDRDPPVARPTLNEGQLYVYSEEDAADIAADAYTWLIQLPELDEHRAEEIATMVYERLTGEWGRTLDGGDAETDT